MTEVVAARGLGLAYRRWRQDRPWSIQEAIQRGLSRYRDSEFTWALRDIDLSIASGTSFGIVGRNGAGKSTLLRVLGGVLSHDQGELVVRGRIGALLELGAGFHPDLTGRENTFVCGVISGLTRREVAARFDEIIAFAELEEFVDTPLRAYSDGMRMRLGFSIAVHCEAEVLLIDEILAVGDIAFRSKCFDRLQRFKESGHTLLIVAHDDETMSRLCDEVMWIDHGRCRRVGEADGVLAAYLADAESSAE